MSVTVDWMDADYSMVHINFMDDWGWYEFYAVLLLAQQLISKSRREVTLMLDLLGSNFASSQSLQSLRTMPDKQPSYLIVVVEQAGLAAEIEVILRSLYPGLKDIHLTSNHLEAMTNYQQAARTLACV